jgi:Ca2+-binding RTX toxin-like protein
VNGDGFDDLLVGAYQADVHGDRSGASFVVFGGNFSGAATKVGTIGDDSLTGTTANDVIFAGTGNDTLDGGGGSDRLSGGAGADVFTLRNVDGTTHVVDFTVSDGDKLDVRSLGYASFADFQTHLSADGPGGHDTKLTIDADTFVILDHVKLDELTITQVTL